MVDCAVSLWPLISETKVGMAHVFLLNTVKCPVESARGDGSLQNLMRSFESLSEQEVLALAIALEEEDERVYGDFTENFRKDFPATAAMFQGMREEESTHRRKLIDLYRANSASTYR